MVAPDLVDTFAFDDVERVARNICEAKHGPGSYDAPHRKRACYRAAAVRVLCLARECGYTGPIYFQARATLCA
jgi:hypothetical protein